MGGCKTKSVIFAKITFSLSHTSTIGFRPAKQHLVNTFRKLRTRKHINYGISDGPYSSTNIFVGQTSHEAQRFIISYFYRTHPLHELLKRPEVEELFVLFKVTQKSVGIQRSPREHHGPFISTQPVKL